ncbi:unnamed protein product [Rhizophagus irregularis]|uniref:Uncharacterized protein n=1 Tax=Rhizophagus irregularis TaxID=588596 RepID=A0A915ZJ89_9GLOM|nr:unnamed protein product [Rhizophagus irregularis]
MIKNFFLKEKYREIKLIVKSEKATLTITTLLLEIFVNEFYRIIWQPRCNLITEWERIKGIKKQDLRKKIPAHQHITYERTPTQQIDGATYDLKGRKILKHSEQWSIALGKTRQYIDQFIREGNRRVVKAHTEAGPGKLYIKWSFRQNPLTNTKGYVLLEDYENTYQVKFIWSQTVLLENNRKFTLGRMTCNFITDSGEFQENNINQTPTPNSQFSIFQEDTSSLSNNLKQPVKKKFRYILPRPLQDMNQSK